MPLGMFDLLRWPASCGTVGGGHPATDYPLSFRNWETDMTARKFLCPTLAFALTVLFTWGGGQAQDKKDEKKDEKKP